MQILIEGQAEAVVYIGVLTLSSTSSSDIGSLSVKVACTKANATSIELSVGNYPRLLRIERRVLSSPGSFPWRSTSFEASCYIRILIHFIS